MSSARISDRVAGALLLAFAIWYWIQAGTYVVSYGDPAGPSFFPRLIAVPLGLFSLFLIVKPDPEPFWFRWPHVIGQLATLAVLITYPLVIEPLGFPLSTFLGTAILARILGGTWLQSLTVGAGVAAGLYGVFDLIFGLPLPLGPVFG